MIQELVNFTDTLRQEGFLNLGLKPKEGLHIWLKPKVIDDITSIDEDFTYAYTKKKNPPPEEVALLTESAVLSQLAWCVNTNKCFDLPIKAIHSCSPYCLALKRENLIGGEKYATNAVGKKSQVYERINAYFAKGYELLADESEVQQAEVFKYAINSEEKLHHWLNQIPEYNDMKDGEYVIFYYQVPLAQYQATSARYLGDKLFNTPNYNTRIEETTFGTSDFFNGFSNKKPYLSHQTASYDISGRIADFEAQSLFDFKEIMGRNILPKPLPIFIDQAELTKKAINIFKANAEEGERIGYQQIIESLYDNHQVDFGNYYLLFYHGGEIKDFDFVSKFDYELRDKERELWRVQDLFSIKYQPTIENVFSFQYLVLVPIFNNALVVKTKTGGFQYRYFDDIDAKYCKTDNTYLLVMQYRKAFYDFIYKSKRQAVTQAMFDHILKTSILDDIRLDEIKNGHHSQNHSIRQKLNIWFSLSEKFTFNPNSSETMANKLQAHREFILRLAKGEASIETDDEYAFAVGQVIAYLMTKSKTADTSYQRLEPFLQQVHAKELNKAISRMFDTYKHEQFSKNFRTPFAEVLAYETKANIRDFMPTLLAGVFSKNALFSDKDVPTAEIEEIDSTEE
jgi:CRISPR-associated protein Csh1